jgi:hypothetical protein
MNKVARLLKAFLPAQPFNQFFAQIRTYPAKNPVGIQGFWNVGCALLMWAVLEVPQGIAVPDHADRVRLGAFVIRQPAGSTAAAFGL